MRWRARHAGTHLPLNLRREVWAGKAAHRLPHLDARLVLCVGGLPELPLHGGALPVHAGCLQVLPGDLVGESHSAVAVAVAASARRLLRHVCPHPLVRPHLRLLLPRQPAARLPVRLGPHGHAAEADLAAHPHGVAAGGRQRRRRQRLRKLLEGRQGLQLAPAVARQDGKGAAEQPEAGVPAGRAAGT